MAVAQRMSEADYEKFVMSGVEGAWELPDGVLVKKSAVTCDRGRSTTRLARQLLPQLDEAEYDVRINEGRVGKPAGTIFIPDLLIVPVSHCQSFVNRLVLAILPDPLPLVVGVWSPSTRYFDIAVRIPICKQCGDLKIWHVHPYDRTFRSLVRQPDGSYSETLHRDGMLFLSALSGVQVDLHRLFAD